MTVYVDNVLTGKWAGHMVADTHDELEDMARRIGLKPVWIQKAGTPLEHYDLTPWKRCEAIRAGAQAVDWRVVARLTIAKREALT